MTVFTVLCDLTHEAELKIYMNTPTGFLQLFDGEGFFLFVCFN